MSTPDQLPRFYAGVGSRNTPTPVLAQMYRYAKRLAQLGFVLRSGAAPGADTAFEEGARDGPGAAEIFVPWPTFQDSSSIMRSSRIHATQPQFEAASQLVSQHHPAWSRLKTSVQLLHSRNGFQVFGLDLQTPVDFVLCWTPDGCTCDQERSSKTGGTGMAISLASTHGIPVFNMAKPGWSEALTQKVTQPRP